MHEPEKLSLWDRFFNRYRTTIYNRGIETWRATSVFSAIESEFYKRHFVEYLVVDRLTGSERIKKEYLN